MDRNQISESNPLDSFRIQSLPPCFYYIPNFITEEEEQSILQKIPSQRWITLSHRRLQAHPATLTANNTLLPAPLPPYLVDPIIPRFEAIGVFKATPHKTPNHVLINEYKKGEGIMAHEDGSAYAGVVATVSLGSSICLDVSQKQMASGEDTFNKADLGLDDQGKQPRDSSFRMMSQFNLPARVLQEPRSLLITASTAYTGLLHGISDIEIDEELSAATVANWALLSESSVIEEAGGKNERRTRVSLTYRDVLKVSKGAERALAGLLKK